MTTESESPPSAALRKPSLSKLIRSTGRTDFTVEQAPDGTARIIFGAGKSAESAAEVNEWDSAMTNLRLRFVHRFRDRHGKVRHYFRRPGFKRSPLPGPPGSIEFMEAYQAALAGAPEPVEIGSSRTEPGSVNAAIVTFYKSQTFTKNKPITQRTDRNILEAFRAHCGHWRIAQMQRKHVMALIAKKADKPAAQRNLLRVLRILLAFTVEQGMRADNPALGIRLKTPPTAGFHSWTEEELRRYEDRHPIGTKARLALALLLYTAQRRSDVVRLRPPHLRDGRLSFTQSKTGAEMTIPLAEPLAEVLAATTMVGRSTFLVTDYGRPFTAAGFGGWFRERCDEAGLSHCSAHGLRKAFLRRMAEAGAQDTFYVGNLKGVGRVYQQTFIDTYAKVAFAKLYDRKTPITAADLLNDRVIPFFDSHEVKLMRVLTDRGSEYCGNPERHEYELYLAVEDVDHTRTKTKSPQTNGICERFHKTALNEFYRVAFRKKVYRSLAELQADLDSWIAGYNEARPHQGRWCFGKTPMQTFLDAMPMTREKMIAA